MIDLFTFYHAESVCVSERGGRVRELARTHKEKDRGECENKRAQERESELKRGIER